MIVHTLKCMINVKHKRVNLNVNANSRPALARQDMCIRDKLLRS